MTKEEFISQFKAARRVSTPLIAIQTADPSSTINQICALYPDSALVSWDIVRGLRQLNSLGADAVKTAAKGMDATMVTNPTEALATAASLPAKSILFMHNADFYWNLPPAQTASVIQGIWNLRDVNKQNGRTLVMLTTIAQLPPALVQDVLILDEPLPSEADLEVIVNEIYNDGGLDIPSPEVIEQSVEAINGLSSYAAEQVTAMCLSTAGVDITKLWERKRQTIEQTPGLSVWRGGETFDDIGGCENVKHFLLQVMKGPEPPNVILFIDEIEKAFAGVVEGSLDTTAKEMLGAHLSWMEDKRVTGIIAVGPPGCAKSMIAKGFGNTAGKLTIKFDLSAMKDSLVGQSNRNHRYAIKVVDAAANEKVLCIATCNSIGALPPELRRRFKFGTFFFDLPKKEERRLIWITHLAKFAGVTKDKIDIDKIPLPDDEGWSGAEIQQCCELAYRLRCNLSAASAYIVPVAKSASELIDRLRSQADGKYISASAPGYYRYNSGKESEELEVVQPRRKFNLGGRDN